VISRKVLITIVLIPLLTLIVIGFSITNASTFTCTSNVCIGSDGFTFADSSYPYRATFSAIDGFSFSDASSGILNGITTVTTYVTSIITQLANSCAGSSCYVNAGAGLSESLAENIIFPLIFILGTVFGFMYMGLRFFGVMIMVATFILLGLAYIGIIPSYFTLLTIIGVGAALTKMISGMIGDSGNSS